VPEPIILVHGGAGSPAGGRIRNEDEVRSALESAVVAGSEVIERGGDALDAAQAAVEWMEDCELFNAGRGSVLNDFGEVEMDAALMDGRDKRVGAVAGLSGLRNPIAIARAVMDHSPHVLLAGAGAERFALGHGFDRVPRHHHVTERQIERWSRERDGAPPVEGADASLGTVGAVVLDAAGNVAAATSTGGLRGKHVGRVGDSPLIGSGTYADNPTCAVSATGNGEVIIRAVAAHETAALIAYKGLGLAEACDVVVRERIGPLGGEAGLLALDASGEIATPFNAGIFQRAGRRGTGRVATAISERELEL